ncbi:hypothetical protein COLO4_18697 [Corchorus olitorius]|uniref:Uncharacterized protein n=1 Tax=Corchorus olitorius TaxID=93759 RepID=A0A1R3J876_9ROSI|nr:hypothetical protein COLO4_18697 [Corchorus olitorius]
MADHSNSKRSQCQNLVKLFEECASVYGKTHSKATSVLRELREECYDVFNI